MLSVIISIPWLLLAIAGVVICFATIYSTKMLSFANILWHRSFLRDPVRISIRSWHRDPIPVAWKTPKVGWTKLNFDVSRRDPIPVAWKKPNVGWTKLNFDGSCKGRTGHASIGGLFRDHKAEFLLGYAESIGKATSTVAELVALRRGIELVLENGWSNVCLEGDAKTLVEIIVQRRQVKCAEMQRHINDINLILPELNNCIVTHVYREGNRAADKLAEIGHGLKKPQVWWHRPPDGVLQILLEDAEGKIIFRNR